MSTDLAERRGRTSYLSGAEIQVLIAASFKDNMFSMSNVPTFVPGQVIPHSAMSLREGAHLQRGMNFRLHGKQTVILMSVRKNAPYADRVENNGKTLIYEGHDMPANQTATNPKSVDQPMRSPRDKLTQNGLFYEAAERYKKNQSPAELVRVYEKIRSGIWTYNGIFALVDAWLEKSGQRHVFKFRLEMRQDTADLTGAHWDEWQPNQRMIPAVIKLQVWQRDKGKCRICGSKENLHFDHIIPYSKGGSSLTVDNVQLLCAKHNLEKHDTIQ